MILFPSTIWLLILVIVVANFVFEQVLDYVNLKAQRTTIPKEVEAFYDKEKYERSLEYHKELTRFSFITSSVNFVAFVLALVFGLFGWLSGVVYEITISETWQALLFFGIIALVADIINTPFQWYATFVIEEKYGFNRTTVKTFILDKLKGYLLGAIIGGGLIALLIYLVYRIGPEFWIWFWVIASVLILLINMFYTSLILPLFNKLKPLPEGELRDAIEKFAQKVKFPLTNIFTMDGSKRSKKANAFFSGMGRKKKIVLYDTLIENHTTDELVAVLAHEIGHYKKRHIILGYILSVAQIGFMLYVLRWVIYKQDVSFALGSDNWTLYLNLFAFLILFSPLSFITGIFMNIISRHNEFQADAYARKTYDGAALATALKKLSVDSLSNLYPHPVYVFFHYSHPPLLKRLEAIE